MTDVDDLKDSLQIDKHQLDEELVRNPVLLFQVSEAYITAVDRRDALKNDLAMVEAEADKRVRYDAEVNEEKVTEAGVRALVLTDKKRMAAYHKYADAKLEADRLGALKEAFAQRSYAIRDLCQLYVANYFQENSMRSDAAADKIMYNRNRRKIAEHRDRVGKG